MFSKSACLPHLRGEAALLLQPTCAYLLLWFSSLVKVVPSRSELGRKTNQIIAVITLGCAKVPQGFKLGVNTFCFRSGRRQFNAEAYG